MADFGPGVASERRGSRGRGRALDNKCRVQKRCFTTGWSGNRLWIGIDVNLDDGRALRPHSATADSGAVAIVNRTLGATGTVRKSIEIAIALRDAGVPVEIWTARGGGALADTVPAGIPIVAFADGSLLGRTAPGLALALARAIRARRPGLLLSGGKHFHLIARAGLALSGRRDVTAFAGRASNTGVRPGRGLIRERIADFFYRMKYGAMDLVIAVSKAIEREVAAKLGPARGRVHCVPNGVDLARVQSAIDHPLAHPWLDAANLRVIASVGRLDPQKGYDTLIRGMAELRDLEDLRLIVVGKGDEAYRDHLIGLARTLGIADRVDLVGFLAEPFALAARADVFVLPSRWEGASNALLEALACGMSIVATDCPGGNREILSYGANGVLAPVDDPAALALAIRYELRHPRDPEMQRAAARRFSLDRCMNMYVTLLDHYRRGGGGESRGEERAPAGLKPAHG